MRQGQVAQFSFHNKRSNKHERGMATPFYLLTYLYNNYFNN